LDALPGTFPSDERDQARLAVLADAVTDAELLGQLRLH